MFEARQTFWMYFALRVGNVGEKSKKEQFGHMLWTQTSQPVLSYSISGPSNLQPIPPNKTHAHSCEFIIPAVNTKTSVLLVIHAVVGNGGTGSELILMLLEIFVCHCFKFPVKGYKTEDTISQLGWRGQKLALIWSKKQRETENNKTNLCPSLTGTVIVQTCIASFLHMQLLYNVSFCLPPTEHWITSVHLILSVYVQPIFVHV